MSLVNKRKIDDDNNDDNNKRIKNQTFTKGKIKSFLEGMNITENNNFNIDIFIDSLLNSRILDDYSIHNKAKLFNLLRYLYYKGIQNINTLEILVNIKNKMSDPFSLITFILNIEIKNLTDINKFLTKVYNSKILNQYSDYEKILLIQLLSEKRIDDLYAFMRFNYIKVGMNNKSKLIDFLNNIETKNLTDINNFLIEVYNSKILDGHSDDEKITIIQLLSEKGIYHKSALKAINHIKSNMNDKSKLIDFLNNIETENLTDVNEFIKRVYNSKILDGYSDDEKINIIKLLSEKGIYNEFALNALNHIKKGICEKSKLIDFLNNIETKNLTDINNFLIEVYNSKILDGHSDDEKITIIQLLSEKGIDNINFLINLKNKSFEDIIHNIKSYFSIDNNRKSYFLIDNIIQIQIEKMLKLISYEDHNLNNKNFNCDNI